MIFILYYIYKTINTINGKIYIGKHKARKKGVVDKFYLGSGTKIKEAIKKYGKNAFTQEILCFCDTEEEAYYQEKRYISEYKNKGASLYNITDGGLGVQADVARDIALERWKEVPKHERQQFMAKAREEWFKILKSGNYVINRTFDREKYISRVECPECKSISTFSHFKHCSKFVHRPVSNETKQKLSKSSKEKFEKDPNLAKRISATLKEKWASGEMEKFTCKECGGRSSNHKKGCSKYIKREINIIFKVFYCDICKKEIKGAGNFKQHLKSKNHIKKLNI